MTQGFLTATPFVLLFLLGFGEKAFSHLKKFILHGKSAFIENNVPNKQTKGDCGKERNSKQCNRCKKIFSSHYICRDHDNGTNFQLYDPNSLLLMPK